MNSLDDKILKLTARHAIPRGAVLTDTYGIKSNQAYLMYYGFLISGPHALETVSVRLGIWPVHSSAVAAEQARQQLSGLLLYDAPDRLRAALEGVVSLTGPLDRKSHR